MNPNYQHLIFDLDRTLWDFETNSRIALHEIFRELDLREAGIADFDVFEKTYKRVNEVCWNEYRNGRMKKELLRHIRFALTLKEFGIDNQELADEMCDSYLYKSPRIPNVMEGTFETLEYLKSRYRLHILTNGFVEVQGLKLERSGLKPYFEQVVASEFAGAKKPHPDAFKFALKKIEAPAQDCLMIGDDPETDILGAYQVGMDTVYYNPDGNGRSEHATFTISHLKELMNFL